MSKCYGFVLMLVIICFLGGSAAYAIPATATLDSFDPATSTYVYKVIQGLDATDSLTNFAVMAFTQASDDYTMTNPSSGGSWRQVQSIWDVGAGWIEYKWYGGSVKPGKFLTVPWVGYFTLSVPGTQPVPGTVWVMGGTAVITSYSANVPGFVPEPSSVAALGVMLMGIGPMILRLRRR
jgi:hypothetical protein